MTGSLFPAIVEKVATRRDNTIAITLGTQELSPAKAGELMAYMNKLTAVYLSPKETISQRELEQVDAVDATLPGKTSSQRLRSVLFLLFKQDAEGFTDFAQYYRVKMESIIEEYKTKIL